MDAAGMQGLVLAAGGGRRFGGPKALACTPEGTPWLVLAVRVLESAGCGGVTVVLGASATDARALVPDGAGVVVADRWADGMGASLAAGLGAAPAGRAVLLTLVDLPGMPATVARRVVAEPGLRRAAVRGRPTHPVQIPPEHVAPMRASLAGDHGARDYLRAHAAADVEVGDLWDGGDVDLAQPERSSERSVSTMKTSGTTR